MKKLSTLLLTLSLPLMLSASDPTEKDNSGESLSYYASLSGQASSGDHAPYMLGSWNNGRYAEANGIWQEGGIAKRLKTTQRFSWSAEFEYIVGYGSDRTYDRYESSTNTWTTHKAHIGRARIQSLYGQLKYRSVLLTAGMKSHRSGIVDETLSSGDLVRSNNAANIPGVGIGFLNFVDVPFTKGWLQIDGEIMYGRTTDSGFNKNAFNYYSSLLPLNLWYNYKRCYFRVAPRQPLSFTVGMQAAGFFGGSSEYYSKGTLVREVKRGFRFKDLFSMFLPLEGGESFYEGSHLGSWDMKLHYRFSNGSGLSLYAEWPWEDGSGIGRMNGWDGLWGVEYKFSDCGCFRIVDKIVVEYLDFTNQSGPIHYAPVDHPDSPVHGHATGGDNYYNNTDYGAYANYGLSIGTPFLKAPYYYSNGALEYMNNRARGFHAAVSGAPGSLWHYWVMVSHSVAGGDGRVPAANRLRSTSAMAEVRVRPFRKVYPLEVGLKLAFDTGSLWGKNFGAHLKLTYQGRIFYSKRHDK